MKALLVALWCDPSRAVVSGRTRLGQVVLLFEKQMSSAIRVATRPAVRIRRNAEHRFGSLQHLHHDSGSLHIPRLDHGRCVRL